jgi:hypothetical protein
VGWGTALTFTFRARDAGFALAAVVFLRRGPAAAFRLDTDFTFFALPAVLTGAEILASGAVDFARAFFITSCISMPTVEGFRLPV